MVVVVVALVVPTVLLVLLQVAGVLDAAAAPDFLTHGGLRRRASLLSFTKTTIQTIDMFYVLFSRTRAFCRLTELLRQGPFLSPSLFSCFLSLIFQYIHQANYYPFPFPANGFLLFIPRGSL